MLKIKSKLAPSIRLVLPATSANLGPAFDAAALALDLYLTIDATAASSFSITATGRDAQLCRSRKNNLVLETYQDVLHTHDASVVPLSLRIRNEIPIGKGCGSSAAARLAGIALANHFGHLGWSDSRTIGEAARREHHPDNAAACWLGGLTVAKMTTDSEAQAVCLRPKGEWPLLLAVPEQSLSTEKARTVLPARYARADVVANIQNSMLLLSALTQGRHDLLRFALEDRIHQPYRMPLCPLLPCMNKLIGESGVLGVALSGAGQSVVIFLDPKVSTITTRKMIAAHLKKSGLQADLLLTSVSSRRAKLTRNV